MLDNFDNLQASWVTQGGKVGQLSLAFGANDMGSVMIEENVVRAAGAEDSYTLRDHDCSGGFTEELEAGTPLAIPDCSAPEGPAAPPPAADDD